jgi:hypothetical protein
MQFLQNNTSKINPIDYIKFPGLDKTSKKVDTTEVPFKIKLRTHQEALLFRALEVDENNSNNNLPFGVLSDKPGAGKTFVVLALIYYSKTYFNSQGINVIVVPHNIYSQWIEAIDKFLGKILTYKCLLEYTEITALFSDTTLLQKYDIIITTPLNYGVLASTINSINYKVRRVFFDEADTMKNLLVNAINSQMTWFISASIQTVFDVNTLKATIGIYNLYLPKLLQNDCYCKKNFIDSNIKLPKPIIEIFICRDFYLDNILTYILNEEQLKYINAHDYTEIRAECDNVSVKNTKEISKYMYLYSKKNVDEQNEILKEFEKKLKYPNRDEYNKLVEAKIKVEQKRDTYLQVYGQLKLLAEKNNICIECWDNLINENTIISYYRTQCNDKICIQCFERITDKYKCIGCKNFHLLDTFKSEEINISSKIITQHMKNKINKFIILDKIIEITGNKILLYSKYRGINNYLKNISIEKNFEYTELNGGNIKEIDNILKKFKLNPQIKILLIDDAYFGIGLNIEYTTDIIFIHDLDEQLEKQIVGRAQRFGRTCSLNIWKILYMNENNIN